MSRAQRILIAAYLMLRRIGEAGIEIDTEWRLEFTRRVERWCAQAQAYEGV